MIDRAAKFAEQAHKGAHRKGTRIPYIVHPLETALIASMLTNDEEILAAALLHDTIEDTGVTYEDLKQEFGTRVADLVLAESEDKSKTWIERKGHTLEHLKTAGFATFTRKEGVRSLRYGARYHSSFPLLRTGSCPSRARKSAMGICLIFSMSVRSMRRVS